MPIKLTANCQDEEHERIQRLERVAKAVQEKHLTKIIALHDHKGTLYVNWSSRPSTQEILNIVAIWSDEAEHHSNHAINGMPLLADVLGDNPFSGPWFE
ncbi:MAG: hypothetical protein ACTHNN_03510 [Xanthobacteraceae bacterium]